MKWSAIKTAPKCIVAALLGVYKQYLSPALPPSCRYTPTCSEFAREAVEQYGVLRGGLRAAWRLLRCNPLAKGGYDPVPLPDARLDQAVCKFHRT